MLFIHPSSPPGNGSVDLTRRAAAEPVCPACAQNMLDSVHAVGPHSNILATDTEQSLHLTVPWRIQPKLNVAALHLTTSGHLGKCSQAAAAQAPAKPSGLFSSLFVSIGCLRIIRILSARF